MNINKALSKFISLANIRSYLLFLIVLLIPVCYTYFARIIIYSEALPELLEEISHFSLHHNFVFLSFAFVVLTEVFYFPLISLIGSDIKKKNFDKISNHYSNILLLLLPVVLLAVAVSAFFIFIEEGENDLYLLFEVITLAIIIINQCLSVYFQLYKRRVLLVLVLIQLVSLIIADLLVINLELPLEYLTLVQAIAAAISLLVTLFFLRLDKIILFKSFKLNTHHLKHFLHLARDSFIDAFLIDLTVILFISNFEVANIVYELLVGLFLIPSLAFNSVMIMDEAKYDDELVIKDHTSSKKSAYLLEQRRLCYFIIQTFITIINVLVVYLFLLNIPQQAIEIVFEAEEIFHEANHMILLILLIIFIRGSMQVNNAIFYARGKLEYLTLEVVIATFFIYVPSFIVWKVTSVDNNYTVLSIIATFYFIQSMLSYYFYNRMRNKMLTVSSTIAEAHH